MNLAVKGLIKYVEDCRRKNVKKVRNAEAKINEIRTNKRKKGGKE